MKRSIWICSHCGSHTHLPAPSSVIQGKPACNNCGETREMRLLHVLSTETPKK